MCISSRLWKRVCSPWLLSAFQSLVFVLVLLLGGCGLGQAPVSSYEPGATRTRAQDGIVMVYVPSGAFLMGGLDADPKASDDEKPPRTVTVAAFWIDRTEVTNAQYARFLETLGDYRGACGGHDCLETQTEESYSHIVRRPDDHYAVDPGYEDHPATEVTWYGARAYCEWAGGRLPTEAEWEKAARGADGRLYPWGDGTPNCRRAQYGDCGGTTAAVGGRPDGASPYGPLDMAGNVWEWVADWYDPEYYGTAPVQNPQGPEEGLRKAFRGGSWGYPAAFLRASDRARNRPAYAGFNLGFRCSSP